jgi:hypothetical protein
VMVEQQTAEAVALRPVKAELWRGTVLRTEIVRVGSSGLSMEEDNVRYHKRAQYFIIQLSNRDYNFDIL